MCTLLHVVFKTHSLLPTWNNFVDALRSSSPYPVPPPPHPSHSQPWSAPNNYPQPTNYPLSTQFLPPPPSEVDGTSATHPAYSQLSHVTPGPTPSRFIPPTLVPVQQNTRSSDAVQSIATPQCSVQPGVTAGMYRLFSVLPICCFEFGVLITYSY